jgi:hypothetical protein
MLLILSISTVVVPFSSLLRDTLPKWFVVSPSLTFRTKVWFIRSRRRRQGVGRVNREPEMALVSPSMIGRGRSFSSAMVFAERIVFIEPILIDARQFIADEQLPKLPHLHSIKRGSLRKRLTHCFLRSTVPSAYFLC